MLRTRPLVALFGFLSLAACSGEGCTACGGITPVPGGYPRDLAIDNAGGVRITRPGLDFLAEEAPTVIGTVMGATGGILTFDIPETEVQANVGGSDKIIICEGGPGGEPPRCRATVGLADANLHVDAVTPSAVELSGTLPLGLSNTRIALMGVNVIGDVRGQVAYGDGLSCNGGTVNPGTPHALPLRIRVPLVEETTAPRNGYTKMDLDNAEIDLSGIQGEQVRICVDCGWGTAACNGIVNSGFIKNYVVDSLKDGIQEQLKTFLGTAFCTSPSPTAEPACPTGSAPNADNTQCMYAAEPNRCVPMLLGTDAHVDLGGFLRAFSPGSKGSLDFGFAAGGAMNPAPGAPADNAGYPGHTPNGITLGMVGGVTPSPESRCVPVEALQRPTGIPTPDELLGDTLEGYGDGSQPHHLGVAMAERFLNYSFKSAYNSGLLCLGISSEQVSMLQSGLLSFLVPSISQLTYQRKSAAAAIATRPQRAPELTLGGGTDIDTDPFIKLAIPELAIDFYIWSMDRYVRVFTYTADVSIPLNIGTAASAAAPNGGIVLNVGTLGIANGTISNNGLLLEEPGRLAGAISQILGSVVSQFVGEEGLGPFDLSQMAASFGLQIQLPQGAIRRLSKDGDQFLGVFASFAAADGTTPPPPQPLPTLVGKRLPAEAMTLEGYDATNKPTLDVEVVVGDGNDLEIATRIDHGGLSPWQPVRRDARGVALLQVQAPELYMQGRHQLVVYTRRAEKPATQSAAASLPFTIDTLPPSASIERATDGSLRLEAWDIVSEESELRARIVGADGQQTEWQPVAGLAIDALRDGDEVEVRDAEGNIGVVQSGLIRGRLDESLLRDGCGCRTAGGNTDAGSPLAWAAGGLLLLGLLARRRGRAARKPVVASLGFASAVLMSTLAPGCSCGSDDEPDTSGCGQDCNQACLGALPQGLVGAYTSAARAGDGTLWVAGYNDAVLSPDYDGMYGDLVVGRYDDASQSVAWETIDGVPERTDGTCPFNDRNGWRGGETDTGNDVGLWTSLAIGEGNLPSVAYYDATTPAVKFARFDGNGWQVHEIASAAGADIGRYSKLVMIGGRPVVAFLHIEAGNGGATRSKIVLARASSATPGSAADWTLSDVAVFEGNPCRATSCGAGKACNAADGRCATSTTGCEPADCGGGGQSCVEVDGAPTCVSTINANTVQAFPDVAGLYISLAEDAGKVALVAYDRVHGNLLGFAEQGSGFRQFIIDGETGDRAAGTAVDTGDVGLGADLLVHDGTWHVAYVEALDETLRYVSIKNGVVGTPVTVDDGYGTEDSATFADGKHVVGDDAALRREGSNIGIFYQDATVGTLRYARGAISGDTSTWTRKVLPQPGRFGGFFPSPLADETRVVHFYRETLPASREIRGNVEVVEAR